MADIPEKELSADRARGLRRLQRLPDPERAIELNWRLYALQSRPVASLAVFGLTQDAYLELYASQGGRCAICKTKPTRQYKRLSIDHDHVTGKVRGLLCMACNTGLGQFKDNDALLCAAVDYLKKHKTLNNP